VKLAVVTVLALAVSCGSHDRPDPPREAERHSRVIEPPSGRVRLPPPHAIRSDGVGPYRLGAARSELLDQLPSGPRIATFDLPGVVHASVLRAEDDAILIGGEPTGKATFIAVVGGEVARTEGGVHVGSSREELVHALGPPVVDLERARDPRVMVPTGMPDARIMLDGDRVAAFVLVADQAPPRKADSADCARPEVDDPAHQVGACLSGGADVVTIDGDDLSVRLADTDKPAARVHVSGLVYAAAIRAPDGRDELAVIAHTEDPQQRSWLVTAFRMDNGRLVRTVDLTPVYQLTATSARWVGAELRGLDLYLEVRSRPDAIEVGGLLTMRADDKLRDVVVISPVQVARKHAKSAAPEVPDAGQVEPAPDSTERRR
jgi:hypothetical protein